MRSHHHSKRPAGAAQLRLITTPDDTREVMSPVRRPRASRAGRNLRMAERLDQIAIDAQREAAEAVMAHDDVSARELLDRASAARRAAALLRAGPSGVRDLLAS
ncbi:MAG: hypothetical protein ACOYL4_08605 [Miltoncostaeaceae bacterium]